MHLRYVLVVFPFYYLVQILACAVAAVISVAAVRFWSRKGQGFFLWETAKAVHVVLYHVQCTGYREYLMYNQAIDPIFNTKVPRLLLMNTKNTPGPRIHPLLDLARNPIRQHGQQSRLGRFHAS